jgi:predicted RecA/RadA family phage recombinase
MKNFRNKGDNLDPFPNSSGSTMAGGTPYLATNTIVIPVVDIPDGKSGAVVVEGCFQVPKVTGRAWKVGEKLFWDVSLSPPKFDTMAGTTATGDCVGCAIASEAAASGDAVGYAKLTPGNTTIV